MIVWCTDCEVMHDVGACSEFVQTETDRLLLEAAAIAEMEHDLRTAS